MKSSKNLTRRGFSPIIQKVKRSITKNNDSSDRKKKSASNYQPINYKPKEFDTYGKSDRKKATHYLKDILTKPESVNKYRIVTEPVDDRVITIVSSSFVPSKSKPKIEHDHSSHKIRQGSLPKAETTCLSCQRYIQQITSLKNQISRVITEKSLWKNGQMNIEDVKAAWSLGSMKTRSKSAQSKHFQNTIVDLKKHFHDLMRDIESLTEIDYPKMLALKIFKYSGSFQSTKSNEEIEIKSLLGQLRQHYEGKITSWDIEDQVEESDHIKAILRNLRARLSHYLRENLELKAKKAILQKAEQMSSESEEYLRLIIEDVLKTYSSKI